MRKIAVIIESSGNLSQCITGLKILAEGVEQKEIEVSGVYIQQSNNTAVVEELLRELVRDKVDVIIIASNWANYSTGQYENSLRRTINNSQTKIITAGFDDNTPLQFARIPNLVGREGFTRACILAAQENLEEIFLTAAKPHMLSLAEALEKAK